MTTRPRPRKRFGQHFLEAAWADRVIDAMAPDAADRFIEIGPGPGILTTRLAARTAHLTVVEIDRDLASALAWMSIPRLEVINADVLQIDPAPVVGGEPARIAGNLPYNISSPILFRLFEWARRCPSITDATLMVQQEFADRLVARAGTKDYGVLTIFTAIAADARLMFRLPPGAFRPMPKVRSAVVQLRFRPAPVPIVSFPTFERVVRSIFTQRRKTLGNAAREIAELHGRVAAETLRAADIDPGRRPETLTLEELARFANLLGAPTSNL